MPRLVLADWLLKASNCSHGMWSEYSGEAAKQQQEIGKQLRQFRRTETKPARTRTVSDTRWDAQIALNQGPRCAILAHHSASLALISSSLHMCPGYWGPEPVVPGRKKMGLRVRF